MQHTPSPWILIERTSNPITYSIGTQVQTKGNVLTTHYIAHIADGTMGAEANARLIAAAPEMLEALLAAKRLFEQALPRFNWGASALDANAIGLLNSVPNIVTKVIRLASAGSLPFDIEEA